MSSVQNYNFLDKFLHYLAFSIPSIQKTLSDVENKIYKNEIDSVKSINPVFVTGLPRSGTTLLLELLFKTDEFKTFSYRHMPFILSPLMWRNLSKKFSKKAEMSQRAHGDGMEISFDSPEAFEEVIWLSYLKDKYVKSNELLPLTVKNTSKEFADNFQIIIKKLLIESSTDGELKRYISKNNANCSRISLLTRLFPSSTILVPFREPLAHIGSLIKQHKQFCEMHKEDKFSKDYMRWLGHFDFGMNFKPINFNRWLDDYDGELDYTSEDFWIQYWVAAYSDIIDNQQENMHFIDFDKLLSSPKDSLNSIADSLKLINKNKFIQLSSEIRSPTSKASNENNVQTKNLDKALALYKELQKVAL